jgi:uncharacterized protein YyaL (SSP411 family)
MISNKLSAFFIGFLLCYFTSCGQRTVTKEKDKHLYTNALIHETSPYLLEHAHNPVDWYPWGKEALDKAKKENKMLLISIGYAACHWCHVMEHECYEDTAVARIMNKNFICIKVDREERPDIDQIYMNASYLINGSGGWPLNALAMPDGKPFFAGTYYPKKNWIQLLKYFSGLYKTDRSKLEHQAENVSKGIRNIENVPFNNNAVTFNIKTLNNMFSVFRNKIDMINGGMKGSMKFPMPSDWEYLLQYHYMTGNEEALKAVESTLDNMANGGIYDQIGGGFSRYSTDSLWHAPHFEKMLYDNAQLISLYSYAFQVTANPLYKKIVYETIGFVERELTSPEGAFYSSIDADSEGKEGKFYVWRKAEIEKILGNNANLFCEYFGITNKGNWESGENIPDINRGNKDLTKEYNLSQEALDNKIDSLKKIVFQQRKIRVRPATDDKILTSWNALMANGLMDAYRAFGDKKFLSLAKKNIDFLLANIQIKNGGLYRNYKNGKANIPAFLDDYAFMINSLINYYQVSFDESYLQKANSLTSYVEQHFLNKTSGLFFYTDDQYSNLIARKMEVSDNVIPSSNSEMAKNLLLLSLYFENKKYGDQSVQMVKNVADGIEKSIDFYSNWAQVLAMEVRPPFEVAIVGKDWEQKLSHLQSSYLPNSIFIGGENEGSLPLLEDKLVKGKTTIYVCENKTCKRPVEQVSEALKQMGNAKN